MDKKSMRILNILPSISPKTGGAVFAVLQLCKEQLNQANEVTLYTTPWPDGEMVMPPSLSKLVTRDIRVQIFPWKRSALMSYLPHSSDLIRALARTSTDFDLIINHSLWNPLATFSMRTLREAAVPYCLMPHGMLDPVVLHRNRWKKMPWAFLWERSNVEGASVVIFNTAAEEQKARFCGWNLHRTFVLPHFMDLALWKNLPARSVFEDFFPQVRGAEVVLFVGRINWVKNLDKLFEALVAVRAARPTVMLICVGPDGDGYKAELEERIRALGLEDHVLFTGMLEGERLRAAYARGNVLALVSQKENFGLAAAEALACGLPVVVSEGVDISKAWPCEGPIRRIKPTPGEISKALIELLERSFHRGLPDSEAQAFAEKEFSVHRVSELLDFWRSLRSQGV